MSSNVRLSACQFFLSFSTGLQGVQWLHPTPGISICILSDRQFNHVSVWVTDSAVSGISILSPI